MVAKELREILKDLPDDTLILQDDPFSEFSYDIKGFKKSYSKLHHTTNKGENFYDSWTEDDFQDLLNDNLEDDAEQIKQEYKPSLLILIETNC